MLSICWRSVPRLRNIYSFGIKAQLKDLTSNPTYVCHLSTCAWLVSPSCLTADQPNPNSVSPVHTPYRGAPGLPAAPPGNSERPLSPALQRTLQPRPQLCHGYAQVTARGLHATDSVRGGSRKYEGSHVRRDESGCVDHVIHVAITYSWAPSASLLGGGWGIICQKLTVTANNTRNVQHLFHPVHRYSLKNVYIKKKNVPRATTSMGLPPVSWTELTDQKCTDFKPSRNNFKLSIFEKKNG